MLPGIRSHASDPVSARRPQSLVSPSYLVLFPGIAAFILYGVRHLLRAGGFTGSLQSLVRDHGELIARSATYWFPIVLVAASALILALLAIFALQDRRRRLAAAAQARARKARPATDLRAVRSHAPAPQPQTLTPAPQALDAALSTVPAPSHEPAAPATSQQSLDAVEVARLRRKAETAALARITPPRTILVGEAGQARFAAPRSLGDSLPMLPARPPIRRRNLRPTLPPAIAAALKLEVASSSL